MDKYFSLERENIQKLVTLTRVILNQPLMYLFFDTESTRLPKTGKRLLPIPRRSEVLPVSHPSDTNHLDGNRRSWRDSLQTSDIGAGGIPLQGPEARAGKISNTSGSATLLIRMKQPGFSPFPSIRPACLLPEGVRNFEVFE